jgi:hypothetical protein
MLEWFARTTPQKKSVKVLFLRWRKLLSMKKEQPTAGHA